MQRFSPGDRIALRELWDGRIWTAYPAIVVEDRNEVFVNHLPSGVQILEAVDEDGSVLRIPAPRWTLRPTRTSTDRVLAFGFPGRGYAVLLMWAEDTDAFNGFYLNIETQLGRTPISYDYVDHLLDVRVAPDRSTWWWKDEDELAEAVARELYTEEDARSFRAAGEMALRHLLDGEPPFDEDWTAGRREPAGRRPELPAGGDGSGPARRGGACGRASPAGACRRCSTSSPSETDSPRCVAPTTRAGRTCWPTRPADRRSPTS